MKRYVSFSGGADSTALAIYLKEQGIDFELVFADTGAELPETYWVIPRVASMLNKKLHVVSNGTFFQHLQTKGFMLPGARLRWCTRILKETPMDAFWIDKDALVSIGIRADEAHRMENKPHRKMPYEYDRPLVDAGFDKKDVLKLCDKYGLLNPCYKWRSNCSCFCCPFQRKQDWKNLMREHPDLYAIAEDWESQAALVMPDKRFTWNNGYSLKQLREADEAQFKMFPECKETACAICEW